MKILTKFLYVLLTIPHASYKPHPFCHPIFDHTNPPLQQTILTTLLKDFIASNLPEISTVGSNPSSEMNVCLIHFSANINLLQRV
jgi:hypothetical protein